MIVGVSMIRDEADVIEQVLCHLFAEGIDHIIVADNLSTDGTSEILSDLSATRKLTVVPDPVVGYYQTLKMTALADRARLMGAEWILPFDADEVFYCPDGRLIADALSATDAEVVEVRGWDHIVRSSDDAPFSDWRRPHQQKLPKVAFRPYEGAWLHMGNHNVERPGRRSTEPLAYRHHQYRSLEQMTRKLRAGKAAYDASDVHQDHGTHWRVGGAKSDAELADEWASLCASDDLVYDPVPFRSGLPRLAA